MVFVMRRRYSTRISDVIFNQAETQEEKRLIRHADFQNKLYTKDLCRYLEENWRIFKKQLHRLVAYQLCSRRRFPDFGG
jgi:hypothetical protein